MYRANGGKIIVPVKIVGDCFYDINVCPHAPPAIPLVIPPAITPGLDNVDKGVQVDFSTFPPDKLVVSSNIKLFLPADIDNLIPIRYETIYLEE